MLRVGEGRFGMELLVTRDSGIGPVLPHSEWLQVAYG